MTNPPTRPYTEEELVEIIKLLSTENNENKTPSNKVPSPPAEPISIKTQPPSVYEYRQESIAKNTSALLPVANPEIPVIADNYVDSHTESKTFFNRYGIWIIVGGIVLLVGAYIYWDYQKNKKEKDQPRS